MLFLLFATFTNGNCNDSLRVLTHSTNDTIRVVAYLEYSLSYRNSAIDSSLIYLKKAESTLADMSKTYDSKVVARFNILYLIQKALYLQEVDQFDSALSYYGKLFELIKHNGTITQLGEFYNNIGALNEVQSKYGVALDHYFKALRIYDSLDYARGESQTLVNIGVVYYRQDNFEEALKYYERALPLKRKAKDSRGEALLYNNIGIIYYYLENYDKVLENFQRSLAIYRQLNDIRSQAMPYYNIAEIYREQNQLKKALYYYKKAYDIEVQLGDISGQAETLSTIGYVYLDLKMPNDAIRVQEEAVRLLDGIGARREFADALVGLSATYEVVKQHDKALFYYKKFKKEHDSIHTLQKSKEIARVKEVYESEKKDNEIELLSERNKIMGMENARQKAMMAAQRRLIVLSLFIAALVLFALVMIYRLYQQKRLSNQMLEFKNNAINRKNDEIGEMVNKLEHAMSAREVFFSNTTHELRTPLNIINGFTNLLQHSARDTQQSYYLRNVKSSTAHLLRLIEDMLAVSQIESGHLKLQMQDVNLVEFVESVISPFNILAEQRKLNFNFSIDESCPQFVRIDPLRYQQVIANLTDNAIKYTPQYGNVKITFSFINNHLHLVVEDSGIGIDAGMISQIFNRYKRGDNVSEVASVGVGLGLSIVKQLAEIQKGTLLVESEAEKGSRFTVTIYAEVAHKATYRFSSDIKITPSDSVRYGRILLVEDNHANIELTIDILKIYMPTLIIDAAESGRKALALITENNYDLLLLDLKMPDMDGFEVASALKELSNSQANIPIIAISAQVETATRKKCKEYGMVGFVEKPYEPVQLINEIERLGVFTALNMISNKNGQNGNASTFLKQPIPHEDLALIVKHEIPDLLEELNVALRERDWEVVSEKVSELRGCFDVFVNKTFVRHVNEIEKECVTTRDVNRTAESLRELRLSWQEFHLLIEKAFFGVLS